MDGGEAGRKAQEALTLHVQGFTYEEIAAQVGYAYRAGAYHAVQRALRARDDELSDEAKHGKAKVYSRYAEMFKVAWEKAKAGDMPAMGHAIKLADRLANIEGVKPPEETLRVQVASEVDEQIMQLSAALNARAQEAADAAGG